MYWTQVEICNTEEDPKNFEGLEDYLQTAKTSTWQRERGPVDIQRETDHTNLGVAYTDKI